MGQPLTFEEVGVTPEEAPQLIYDLRRRIELEPVRVVTTNVNTERIFDAANINWEGPVDGVLNNAFNKIFLNCQQNYANDRLNARGFVFLNELYHQLGFEHTRAGAVLGWMLESDDPDFPVTGFVDLGLYSEASKDFMEGRSNSITLTFNCDGVIFHRIKES